MAVKIKLKRLGKIRAPYYRIVVADARTKRDGRAIEEIGKYHPKADPSLIEVDSERAQHWLSVGAQPTDPVRKLFEVTGDWQKFKGLPGAEGTLQTAAPRADKKVAFAAAVAETVTDGATTPKGRAKGKAADAKGADAKSSDAKGGAEAKGAEAKGGADAKAAGGAKGGADAKAAGDAKEAKAAAKSEDAKGAAAKGADAKAGGKADKPAKGAKAEESSAAAQAADKPAAAKPTKAAKTADGDKTDGAKAADDKVADVKVADVKAEPAAEAATETDAAAAADQPADAGSEG